MSTTIRISNEDKSKLDNLLRYLSFQSHRKITQEEFMANLIRLGEDQKETLAEQFTEVENPDPDMEDDSFFHLPKLKLGPKASKDYEQELYGDGH